MKDGDRILMKELLLVLAVIVGLSLFLYEPSYGKPKSRVSHGLVTIDVDLNARKSLIHNAMTLSMRIGSVDTYFRLTLTLRSNDVDMEFDWSHAMFPHRPLLGELGFSIRL